MSFGSSSWCCSAWVIWPIFSSRVIFARRAATSLSWLVSFPAPGFGGWGAAAWLARATRKTASAARGVRVFILMSPSSNSALFTNHGCAGAGRRAGGTQRTDPVAHGRNDVALIVQAGDEVVGAGDELDPQPRSEIDLAEAVPVLGAVVVVIVGEEVEEAHVALHERLESRGDD